jgi:hypothetical protein
VWGKFNRRHDTRGENCRWGAIRARVCFVFCQFLAAAIGFNFIAGEHTHTTTHIAKYTHVQQNTRKGKGGGFSLSLISHLGAERSFRSLTRTQHQHIFTEENKIMASSRRLLSLMWSHVRIHYTQCLCARAPSLAIISIRNIWRNNETPQEICGAHDSVPAVRRWCACCYMLVSENQ